MLGSEDFVCGSKNFLFVLLAARVCAKDVVLTGLAETGDAMLLAGEFVTELKLVYAALYALVASDGKSAAATE
jgi:hypothetical protein